MNLKKWQDWRLDALTEETIKNDGTEDEKYITITESFYHLNSEAKLGLSIRQMKKHMNEIEKQFRKTVESGKVDEAQVESWARTYESLKFLDEKLHKLMKEMYKGK